MNAAAMVNEVGVIFGITGGSIVGAMLLVHGQTERNYGSRKMRWPKPGRHNRKR